MDTVERGVANDPHSDAGLGRISSLDDEKAHHAKAGKRSHELDDSNNNAVDIEAGSAGHDTNGECSRHGSARRIVLRYLDD